MQYGDVVRRCCPQLIDAPVASMRQVSSVKVRHLDPEWNEVFDLPVLEVRNGLTEIRDSLTAKQRAENGVGSTRPPS